MSAPRDTRQRLEELMLERATSGLLPRDREEYLGLAGAHPDLASDDGWDLAAAAVDAAFAAAHGDVEQPLPPDLRARLLARGRFLAAAAGAGADLDAGGPAPAENARPPRPATWMPWLVAAALLVLAALGWMRAPQGPGGSPAPDLAEERRTLGARPETRTLPWTSTGDEAAAGATGDVVWNGDADAGYMRFAGLQPNDPAAFQYQLWIFDETRDERFPVDGGVFDIPAGATEVIVPIRAKLPVDRAVLFAVTVEPPGGVVVSSRERIVLTAAEAS